MPSFAHSDAVRPGARTRNAARHGPPPGPRLDAGHLILASLWALGLASCTSPAVESKPSIYGAISLPPDAKAIGLTVTRPCPEFTLQLPETKQDASRSVATAGAKDMLRDPYAAILFPVGYLLGGITGGMLGVNEGELKTATRSISAVVGELHFDERVVQMVGDHLKASHPGRIRALEDNIPLEPGATQGHMRRDESGRLIWIKPPPAPHPLAGTDLDTVVGLRVTFLGFQARSNPHVRSTGDVQKLNPPLALVLSVDVTAVRVRDWADLGGLTASYESTPRKFTEWAAADAQPVRREMETGRQEIFRQIARQLTLGPAPAGSTSGNPSAFR